MNAEPMIITPLTPFAGYLQPAQWHPRCRNVEYDAADCIEAYGFHRATKKCKDLISDLTECLYNVKQDIRLEIMHLEYMRQIKEGKREFIPPPRVSYYYV